MYSSEKECIRGNKPFNQWVFLAFTFLKFILFNIIWCSYTTFQPFSHIQLYFSTFTVAMLLTAPYYLFRSWKYQIGVLLLIDVLFITNLMYYRTYFTAIPLSSYLLVGNLADFTQSVFDSIRWYDALFPLSTAAIASWYKKTQVKHTVYPARRLYSLTVMISCLIVIGYIATGAFKKEYNGMKSSAHLYASTTPYYTLFGNLYYDFTERTPHFTADDADQIGEWLNQKPALTPLSTQLPTRKNCILILAESLESWVLEQTVEEQEITPYLNQLLKDSTTLYAPHVLTQVKGGRSIDAQLMLCAGLLPIINGTYSVSYPNNLYYTLPKALKEQYGNRCYLLTVDKEKTWNQAQIARSFGVDTILSYPDFNLTEAFGNRKRVGDVAFFAQCQEKMEKKEIWKEGEKVYMQFVTYSGHAPFILPDELKQLKFSAKIPEVMNNYMTTANYTDRAIGRFIDYLKTRPEYKETLIVITGDHEGLAFHRHDLCQSEAGKDVVSNKQYTPFIVINSPVGMRYEPVMGQIDMYPTLLNLLHLENYQWSGIGESILSPHKKGIAVGSKLNVEGDTGFPEETKRLQEAHDVSDKIIRFDYFRQVAAQ